jgi:hypothetical protein
MSYSLTISFMNYHSPSKFTGADVAPAPESGAGAATCCAAPVSSAGAAAPAGGRAADPSVSKKPGGSGFLKTALVPSSSGRLLPATASGGLCTAALGAGAGAGAGFGAAALRALICRELTSEL